MQNINLFFNCYLNIPVDPGTYLVTDHTVLRCCTKFLSSLLRRSFHVHPGTLSCHPTALVSLASDFTSPLCRLQRSPFKNPIIALRFHPPGARPLSPGVRPGRPAQGHAALLPSGTRRLFLALGRASEETLSSEMLFWPECRALCTSGMRMSVSEWGLGCPYDLVLFL